VKKVLDEKWMMDIAERAAAAGLSGEEVRTAILEGVSEAHRIVNAPPPPEPEAPEPQPDGLDPDRTDADRLAAAHEASRRVEARRNRANEAVDQHYRERQKQELLASWTFRDPVARDREARELGLDPTQINANLMAQAKTGDTQHDDHDN
jgi:hypothetical protein